VSDIINERRGFRAGDILRVRTVADPQVSPDGSRVAYVVTSVDAAVDEFRSHIWIAPLVGGEPRQLTRGPHKDSAPRWSPDGKTLAFVSNRAAPGESGDAATRPGQIWLIGESGEPWRLTETVRGASSTAWSPDGQTIAFITKTRLAGETKRDDERTPVEKHAPRVIRDLVYRFDGEGQFDDTFAHLWTIPASGGPARQLTHGDFGDAEPQWSRAGREIVLLSYREADRGEQRRKDVWVVETASGAARKLTASKGPSQWPTLSPDGATIAYMGNVRGDEYGSCPTLLWTVPLAGGEPRALTEALDRSTFAAAAGAPLAWTPDGRELLFLVLDAGASSTQPLPVKCVMDPAPKITSVAAGDVKVPVGPCGPVAPVAPSAPAGPCGPVGPWAPSAPVAPVGPAAPVSK